MGQITSHGCARNNWITLDFVSCGPIIPGAATQCDQTCQVKFTKVEMRTKIVIQPFDSIC